jgi:hypothetical protein
LVQHVDATAFPLVASMTHQQSLPLHPRVSLMQKDVTIIGYMAVISTLCSGFICAVKKSERFVKPADTLQWLVLLLGIGVCAVEASALEWQVVKPHSCQGVQEHVAHVLA